MTALPIATNDQDALVVAELSEGKLRPATLAAVTFARQAVASRGGRVSILVAGRGAANVALELSTFSTGMVLVCDHPDLESPLSERHVPTIARAAEGFGLVVSAATSWGKELMPRVAARLGCAYASDCVGVEDTSEGWLFRRPLFAGNALSELQLKSTPALVTVRQSAFAAAKPHPAAVPIRPIDFSPPGRAAARIEIVGFEPVASHRPELGEAKVVVAGGRGIRDQFFELLGPLADHLGAALGATRGACDSGVVPGDYQVGQTGKVIAPDLYIAVGISGAIQHLAGIRGARTIVAINTDPDAPIFEVANYGLVANAFDAVPELIARLPALPQPK